MATADKNTLLIRVERPTDTPPAVVVRVGEEPAVSTFVLTRAQAKRLARTLLKLAGEL